MAVGKISSNQVISNNQTIYQQENRQPALKYEKDSVHFSGIKDELNKTGIKPTENQKLIGKAIVILGSLGLGVLAIAKRKNIGEFLGIIKKAKKPIIQIEGQGKFVAESVTETCEQMGNKFAKEQEWKHTKSVLKFINKQLLPSKSLEEQAEMLKAILKGKHGKYQSVKIFHNPNRGAWTEGIRIQKGRDVSSIYNNPLCSIAGDKKSRFTELATKKLAQVEKKLAAQTT